MSRTIAVANQKGGVGKTTTTISLGACLSDLGKKVLLVDMDPQQHVNLGLSITPEDMGLSTYDLMIDPQANPDSSIVKCSDNLHVLPSNLDLAMAEYELMGKVASDKRLSNQLNKIEDRYDFIIIDCPPSIGLLTINSLLASQEVIMAIDPEFLAMQGVIRLLKLLEEITGAHQKKISYYTLITRCDSRIRIAKEVCAEVRKQFGDLCLKTVINNNVKLKEAVSQGISIHEYDKSSKGYEDYFNLAKEILNKKPD